MGKLDKRLSDLEVLAKGRQANRRCEKCIKRPAYVLVLPGDPEPEPVCDCEQPLQLRVHYVDIARELWDAI